MSMLRWMGLLLVVLMLAACNNGMEDQPKYEPYEASTFFENGMSARPLVANTVARGQLRDDRHLYAGQVDGALATDYPFPITEEVLARGQERYNIYCTPCHGYAGYGDGIIVQRGFTAPPSFHQERLRTLPVGYIFEVTTNGIGAMYSYGERIMPEDRWAIIAYMQALQLSQNQAVGDLPADVQTTLQNSSEEGTGAGSESGGETGPDTEMEPGGTDPASGTEPASGAGNESGSGAESGEENSSGDEGEPGEPPVGDDGLQEESGPGEESGGGDETE